MSFTPFWASRGGSQRCLFTPVLGFPGCPRSVFYASSGLPRKCPRGVFYAVLGFPGCPRGVFYAAFQAREAQDQGSQGRPEEAQEQQELTGMVAGRRCLAGR